MRLTDEEKAVLDTLRDDYRALSLDPTDAVPDVLYHYTSGEGLLGIVTSARLRATNFAYLNDFVELTYGVDVVRRVVTERFTHSELENSVRMVTYVRDILLDTLTAEADLYIVSFCTERDLLSQWRGYGAPAGRFCLAFRTEGLMDLRPPCRLDRAVYAPETQEQRVHNAIQLAVDALAGRDFDPNADFPRRVAMQLAAKIRRALPFFKHPGFSEECEWRLLRDADPDRPTDLRFVAAANGIIRPYIDLEVEGANALPLSKVIVGSSPLPATTVVRTTKMMLAQHGYQDVEVTASQIPFRGW
jgi:hypothetical protein